MVTASTAMMNQQYSPVSQCLAAIAGQWNQSTMQGISTMSGRSLIKSIPGEALVNQYREGPLYGLVVECGRVRDIHQARYIGNLTLRH